MNPIICLFIMVVGLGTATISYKSLGSNGPESITTPENISSTLSESKSLSEKAKDNSTLEQESDSIQNKQDKNDENKSPETKSDITIEDKKEDTSIELKKDFPTTLKDYIDKNPEADRTIIFEDAKENNESAQKSDEKKEEPKKTDNQPISTTNPQQEKPKELKVNNQQEPVVINDKNGKQDIKDLDKKSETKVSFIKLFTDFIYAHKLISSISGLAAVFGIGYKFYTNYLNKKQKKIQTVDQTFEDFLKEFENK